MMTLAELPDKLGGPPLLRASCEECKVWFEAFDEPPYRAAIEHNLEYHNEKWHG